MRILLFIIVLVSSNLYSETQQSLFFPFGLSERVVIERKEELFWSLDYSNGDVEVKNSNEDVSLVVAYPLSIRQIIVSEDYSTIAFLIHRKIESVGGNASNFESVLVFTREEGKDEIEKKEYFGEKDKAGFEFYVGKVTELGAVSDNGEILLFKGATVFDAKDGGGHEHCWQTWHMKKKALLGKYLAIDAKFLNAVQGKAEGVSP